MRNTHGRRTWGVLGKQKTYYSPSKYYEGKFKEPLNANPLDSWDIKRSRYKRVDGFFDDTQQGGVVVTTPTPTLTPSITPSVTPTPTLTPTPSFTPTLTQTPTNTVTVTLTQTLSPTVTPTITASQTLTPTITPTNTNTPTNTPYVADCCFSAVTNPLWTGGNTITEIKSLPDGSIYFATQQPGTLNGISLNYNNRMPSCGTPTSNINTFTPGCLSFSTGLIDNFLYQPQSDNKLVFVGSDGGVVYRYNNYTTRDSSFNETVISAATSNTANITGLYINPSDQIYIFGKFDGVRNCSGLTTNQTFNTNLFRLNANGSIDTSYSGITLDGIALTTNEPRVSTERDPSGNVLVLCQSGFTGNTAWRGVLRFKPDGTPDSTFDNSLFSAVTLNLLSGSYCQSDGKYIVWGGFTNLAGTGRNRMVRLNSNGTLDTSFTYSGAAAPVDCEQDVYGNYHLTNSSQQYQKLNNSGITQFTYNLTNANAICVTSNSVYVGGNSTTNYAGYTAPILKFDFNGNLNMCVLPTPTPTQTPTQTPTPSFTPTNTITPSITATNTLTPSITATNTETPTQTQTPSITPSVTPSTGGGGNQTWNGTTTNWENETNNWNTI